MQEELTHIRNLFAQRCPVVVEELPELFRSDIRTFLMGATMSKGADGKWYCSPQDFAAWVHKIQHEGFDHEIQLAQ